MSESEIPKSETKTVSVKSIKSIPPTEQLQQTDSTATYLKKEKDRKRKFSWTPARRESFQKCIDANKKMRDQKENIKSTEMTKINNAPVQKKSTSKRKSRGLKKESESSSSSSSGSDTDSSSCSTSTSTSSTSSSLDSEIIVKKRRMNVKKAPPVKRKDFKKVMKSLHKITSELKRKKSQKSLKIRKIIASKKNETNSEESHDEYEDEYELEAKRQHNYNSPPSQTSQINKPGYHFI